MKPLKILLSNNKSCIFVRNINTLISVCNANFVNTKSGCRKITKIHQKSREDKYMFGPLKKKGKKTVDLNEENVTMDSELWWNLKLNKSKMITINIIENTPNSITDNIVCSKSNIDNLSLDCDENKVASKSKKNKIKSKRTEDIKKRRGTSDKKRSKSKKNDSVQTEAIPLPNEVEPPKPKIEKLLDANIIKPNRFPIFTEQKRIFISSEKSEILSVSQKDDPEMYSYPSVTKILAETMTPTAQRVLRLWKEKLIREMGEEKFNEYHQEILSNGKAFHSCIEDTLFGREVNIPENILPAYNSLSSIVNELQDIKAVESFVSHKGLYYKGKVDCIAYFRGKLCIIDWKKSDKDKENLAETYDAPLQLAAYAGAINSSNNYQFSVHSGLIVIGYTTGKPADTFFLSGDQLQTYWFQWLAKLKQYWSRINNQATV
ncbi:hypothetical protein M0802_009320 [Mischocyttarus mexicanus]|nr:hypothetical protein M0802_009320 [Mischocyttarus mexicanus]